MISLIPLGLWQLKMGFSNGLMNLKKIPFLKVAQLSGFLMSKLFHSIKVDAKKEFLKKLY